MTRQLALFATVLSVALPAAAAETAAPAAIAHATGTAQADLDRALADLSALREQVAAEKLPLTRKLGELEEKLASLRRREDEVARGQDTTSLETTNLESAMKLRQDEITYVGNLLDEYARGFQTTLHPAEKPRYEAAISTALEAQKNSDLRLEDRLNRQTELLRVSLARAGELLGGTRFEGEAVDPQGKVEHGQFAMIGPVMLFAGAGGAAGLALPQAGSDRAAVRPLEPALSAGIAAVATAGEGLLPLDPSRGGALQELVSRWSLIDTFRKGGPIMWPLLVVSILAVSVILERLFFLARTRRRRDRRAVESIMACLEVGDVNGASAAGRGSEDFIARALTYALQHREKSLSNALSRAAGLELVRFTRGIAILDTCVTIAPLLGLLGTVTGMMGAFGTLGGSELSAPAQITGGIAEALIATAFGLMIAVSALIPMSFLHGKADAARHEMEDACTHCELLMKPVLEAERRFIADSEEAAPAPRLATPRVIPPGAGPTLERA